MSLAIRKWAWKQGDKSGNKKISTKTSTIQLCRWRTTYNSIIQIHAGISFLKAMLPGKLVYCREYERLHTILGGVFPRARQIKPELHSRCRWCSRWHAASCEDTVLIFTANERVSKRTEDHFSARSYERICAYSHTIALILTENG